MSKHLHSSKLQKDKSLLNREWKSIVATLEILADRELTARLLKLSKTIDSDVAAGRFLTFADVFGETDPLVTKPQTNIYNLCILIEHL